MRIMNVVIDPKLQVLVGSWCFFGIPMAISGGVGALYRIESNLRAFFWYLLFSFFFGISIPMYLLFSGTLCGSFVSPEVRRMGTAFVCSFTDTFVFFYTLLLGLIHLYNVYIVWSAAEEVAETPFPELVKYSDVLRKLNVPSAGPGPFAVNERAVPEKMLPENAYVAPNFAPAPQATILPQQGQMPRLNAGPPMPPGQPQIAMQGYPSYMSTAVPSSPAGSFPDTRAETREFLRKAIDGAPVIPAPDPKVMLSSYTAPPPGR